MYLFCNQNNTEFSEVFIAIKIILPLNIFQLDIFKFCT